MSKIYPNLKFGEITIQYDDSWIKHAFRYFNYDTKIDATTNVVFLFHDTNEVTSTMDIIPDKGIIFSELRTGTVHPYLITISNNSQKLHKRNVKLKEDNTTYLPGFVEIYSNKYKTYLPDPSIFNCIYCVIDTKYPYLERVTFSLMKRKYGVNSSRFLFSYDPEIITKKQVEYIIYKILTSEW